MLIQPCWHNQLGFIDITEYKVMTYPIILIITECTYLKLATTLVNDGLRSTIGYI